MHTFEQVKDVIHYSKKIHARLRKFYRSLNEKSQSERVKMLLDYLIEDQRHIEETLSSFEAVTQPSVLDTWMQYAPSIDIHQLIDNQQIRSGMSVDEIVQLAAEFGEAFVDFYREAANESDLPKVSKIFQNLAEMETEEKLKQLRAALFEDM
jgi:rubrerythrin